MWVDEEHTVFDLPLALLATILLALLLFLAPVGALFSLQASLDIITISHLFPLCVTFAQDVLPLYLRHGKESADV